MMLLWILIAIGLFFVIRNNYAEKSEKTNGNAAAELLKKRYASGEIDEETYISMKKELDA